MLSLLPAAAHDVGRHAHPVVADHRRRARAARPRLPRHPPPARGLDARGGRLVGVLRRAAAGLRRVGLERPRRPRPASSTSPATSSRSRCRSTTSSSSCCCSRRSPCRAYQQRVLLFGIAGALVLRGIFIALGAAAHRRPLVGVPALRGDPAAHRRQGAARRALGRRPRGRRLDAALGPAAAPLHAGHRRLPRHRGCSVRENGRRAAHADGARRRRRPRHRRRLRDRLRAGGLRHHRGPVPRVRDERLRPARPARAVLRPPGRARLARRTSGTASRRSSPSSASSSSCTGRTASGPGCPEIPTLPRSA